MKYQKEKAKKKSPFKLHFKNRNKLNQGGERPTC